MKPLHIEVGQYVVAFPDEFFYPGSDTATEASKLIYRGGGWEGATREILVVRHVTKVMPKTYEAGARKRLYRDQVIAVADTFEQAEAIRAKLVAIGVDAGDEIEREVAKLAEPIRQRVEAAATAKLHAALPHIFGRDA